MQIIQFGSHYRVKDCLPQLNNFWIDVDPIRQEINIPSTGPIGATSATDLVKAIQYATDLAIGKISI